MVLKGGATKIRTLITDADGAPVAKDVVVKVTVTKDSTGAAVVTDAEVKTDESGIATYELAAQPTLDRFTVTWKPTVAGSTFTTVEEMVGLRLCALSAVDEDVTESISAERKRVARDIAEQLLEDECGVAWRPRYANRTLDGTGTTKLLLPDPKVISVRSITLEEPDGTTEALSAEELEEVKLNQAGGFLYRADGWPSGYQNVSVIYEHGFTNPPPKARQVAGLLARHVAVKRLSNMDDRATHISTDEAAYTVVLAGARGAVTSLPEVNAFIDSWQFPQVG